MPTDDTTADWRELCDPTPPPPLSPDEDYRWWLDFAGRVEARAAGLEVYHPLVSLTVKADALEAEGAL